MFGVRPMKLVGLFIAFLTLSTPFVGYSANVLKKISKRRAVQIDAGITAGFVKGAPACVFDEDAEIGCGTVGRASKNKSMVRFPPPIFKKVKPGMEVRLQDAEEAVATTGEAVKNFGEAALAKSVTNNFKFLYVASVLPPASYQKLSYRVPATTTSPLESLWTQSEESGMALIGLALEFEFGSMAAGLRYRIYREFIAEANYNPTNSSQFVESTQSATAIGLYYDYYVFQTKFSDSIVWKIGIGLDIDLSSQKFAATQKDDNNPATNINIASASSTDMVASLRINLPFQMEFGGMGLTFGPNILLPLYDSPGVSATVSDPNAQNLVGKTGPEDLADSLDHKKAAFGVEFLVGAQLYF